MAEPNGQPADPSSDITNAELGRRRLIRSAIGILAQRGGTDFTVQELVKRSRTSLRTFYQHFGTKDELLLALFEEVMVQSAQSWRSETAPLSSTHALRLLIDRVGAQPDSTMQDSLNRALTFYNHHLADSRPREYARVLSPLHLLVRDIVSRGIAEGVFRADLDVKATAAIVMQTILGTLRLHTLGTELTGTPVNNADIYEFCLRGLIREMD